VERTVDGGRVWTRLATAPPQADGSLVFTDAAPPGAEHVGYRATVERRGQVLVLGTASLALGAGPPTRFALAPPRPNPASDDVVVELSSPVDAEVTLELFDLSGRRIGSRQHRRVGAGSAAFTLPLARGLAPGVYLLRVSDGTHFRTSRLAIVR